jgi:hypothetical protein
MKELAIILAALCLLNLGFLMHLRTIHRRAVRMFEDVQDMRKEAEGMLIRFLELRIEESGPDDKERARAVKYLNWMRARDLPKVRKP